MIDVGFGEAKPSARFEDRAEEVPELARRDGDARALVTVDRHLKAPQADEELDDLVPRRGPPRQFSPAVARDLRSPQLHPRMSRRLTGTPQ